MEREIALMRLLCQDKTTTEIATCLDISPRTVESDRDKLRKKLGIKTVAGLAAYSVINGIYDPLKHSDPETGERSQVENTRVKYKSKKR